MRTQTREISSLIAAGLLLASSPVAYSAPVFPSALGSASSTRYTAEVTLGGSLNGFASSGSYGALVGFRASLPTSGPTLAPVNAIGSAGREVRLAAFIEDDVAVVSATLHYRVGGTTEFLSVPMVEEEGEWSARVPAEHVSVRGIQYYLSATDGVTESTAPFGAPVTRLANLPVAVSDHEVFTLEPERYRLASLPLAAANADPEAVFAPLGGYDPMNWRYATWDSDRRTYLEPPGAALAEPGQGFWIVSRREHAIGVDGSSTTLETVRRELRPNYNLVGNPFAFPVAVASLELPDVIEGQPFYGWSGSEYQAVTVLQPGEGYWVENPSGVPVEISIPPTESDAAQPAPTLAGLVAAEGRGWAMRVRAEAAGSADDLNRFGQRPGATDRRDAFDLADPPIPPAGYVALSFVSDSGTPLLTDYRPEGDGQVWTLRFQSDRAGEAFRVRFLPEGDLPAGSEVRAIQASGAVDVDLTGGSTLSGVVPSDGSALEWTIVAGSARFVEDVREEIRSTISTFALTAPFPNPVRSGRGVSLDLAVPRSSSALVQIFNVQGRLVSTLVEGRVAAGNRRLTWDGRDRTGRRVPSGVYFVKARAESFSASQKVVVLQ